MIGQGGMGAVYLARQVSLDRLVAVKILPPQDPARTVEWIGRFRQEARTLAQLSHPAIVAVHDFGEADGGLYFAMEYLEGGDLARRIESGGPLPAPEAAALAIEVCGALHSAHACGVVHRDIKPANLLLTRDGRVKVADFGLAKITDPARPAGLTLSNTSMGTRDFAAPETLGGADTADPRADIYSLGVVLYQLLTGDLPRGLFKMPSAKVPGLDPRWDGILCRALEEDREDRYPTILDLRADLEGLARAVPALVPADPPQGGIRLPPSPLAVPAPRRRLSRRRVLAALALVPLITGTVWFANRDGPGEKPRVPDPHAPGAGWQDLLARIDLSQHRRNGYWKFANGELANQYEIGADAIAFPLDSSTAYDLRLSLTRQTPGTGGTLAIPFQYGSRASQFVISEYVRPSARIGAAADADTREDGGSFTAVGRSTLFLPLGQRREIVLQVRDEGVAVRLDGEELVRWIGGWDRLGDQTGAAWLTEEEEEKEERPGRPPITGLYVHSGLVVVHAVAYRPLPGAAGRTLPAPGGAPPDAPPLGATFEGNGHRYQYFPGPHTWKEAQANARSLGGHLATVTDQAEHDWLWRTFSPHLPIQAKRNFRSRGWWLGGTESADASYWLWLSGEPFDFARWFEGEPDPAAKPPRALWQHDNASGSAQSSWRAIPAASKHAGGYVVEWDQPHPYGDPASPEAAVRGFAAWLFSLPPSTEPSHAEHRVPDLIVDGGTRNLRRLGELPAGPFAITRVRIGPLALDAEARRQLEALGRMRSLYDLRIYAAADADALAYLRDLTRLGTLVFKAAAPGSGPAPRLPDAHLAHLAHLAALANLGSLRLEGWSGFTGIGLAHLSNRKKLASLSLGGCPDLGDAALAEAARFPNLRTLGFGGPNRVTDAGIAHLRGLAGLETLVLDGRGVTDASVPALASLNSLTSLEFGDAALSEAGIAALRRALPGCDVVRRSGPADPPAP